MILHDLCYSPGFLIGMYPAIVSLLAVNFAFFGGVVKSRRQKKMGNIKNSGLEDFWYGPGFDFPFLAVQNARLLSIEIHQMSIIFKIYLLFFCYNNGIHTDVGV